MSAHAALTQPAGVPRGRHAKPRPAWPRVAGRAVFLLSAPIAAVAVLGAGWPPVLLVVPVVALLLFVASVAKLRTVAVKIDIIFAEELTERDAAPDAAERVTSSAADGVDRRRLPAPHLNM